MLPRFVVNRSIFLLHHKVLAAGCTCFNQHPKPLAEQKYLSENTDLVLQRQTQLTVKFKGFNFNLNWECILYVWCHLHYHPGWSCAQFSSGWAKPGAFTSLQSGPDLNQKFLHHSCSKRTICLLYAQTRALYSRQQMTYDGMRATHSPARKPSQVQLTSTPEWQSVNALPCAQPGNVCQYKGPRY